MEVNNNREELRRRLREKISNKRQPKQQVNQKTYNKMMEELATEMKKMNEDERITPKMLELYDKVSKKFDKIKVPSPLELLNNQELGKQKFKEYLIINK